MRRSFVLPLGFGLALSLGLLASPAFGLRPHLVKDINAVPFAQGSSPSSFASLGSLALFAADDGLSGSELWRSDGTEAGTFRLADACPGECHGRPVVVARGGGLAFFRAFARNGFGPVDLWATDGTPGGTVRLGGPFLLPASGRALWIASQGLLYFAANDLSGGSELWRSDGTAGGTFEVVDLRPGFAGSEPAELTEFEGRLYFRADDGQRGPALWTSDGTAAGTRLVLDPLPQAQQSGGPELVRVAGGALYFSAPVSASRTGLWRSDGTTAGTSAFFDLPGASPSGAFLDATVLAGRLLFVAFQAAQGRELWTTDGTRSGTQPLTRFAPASPFQTLGADNARLLPERAVGGRLVFRADDGQHGAEPWATDGTAEGTRLLADLCPGRCPGVGGTDDAGVMPAAAGSVLFFPGSTTFRGTELWATDGTPEGTRLVRDLCRQICSSDPSVVQVEDETVYLLAKNALGVAQLWRSDGTARGTLRLTSFPAASALLGTSPGASAGPGLFLFGAGDEGHGRELWRSDGTVAGTAFVADLNRSDFGGSFPTGLRAAGGKGWFFANDGIHGFELWNSDGSGEGTRFVYEFTPGPEPALAPKVAGAVDKDGRLCFLLQPAAERFSLWCSDGEPGGTERLTPSGLDILATEPLRLAAGRIFFVATDTGGEELWASDGTPAGTGRVADLVPGTSGSSPRSLAVFEDRLYFTAQQPGFGRELWRSDGTAAGTVLVKDIDPRPGIGSEPALLTVHAGRLFFPANDEEHGIELWSSDGTEAGTRLEVEVVPGPVGLFVTHLVSAGRNLYFSGGPPSQALRGLWVSDGTAAGTRQVGSLMVNVDRGASTEVGVFEDQIFFASQGDQVTWRSDGTEEGTGPLLTDEGAGMDEPQSYRAFAGRMLFTAAGTLFESDGTQAGTRPVLVVTEPPGTGVEVTPFELSLASGRLFFRSWERLTGSELWALEEE